MGGVKNKGNRLERLVAADLRNLYPFTKTSRATSKQLDNCKIDLSGLPILIQCKSGYNNNRPKYEVLYKEMKELTKLHYAPGNPIHKLPYVLIHKLNGTKGKVEPELFQVTMNYQFFLELVKNYKSEEVVQ